MDSTLIMKTGYNRIKTKFLRCIIAAAALAVTATTVMMPTTASAETRSLKLYYVHTGERAEITFKKNGRFLKSGLQKLNVFLRDWRRNEPTKMDPRLFDLVWQVYKASGSSNYITVVSAYRSPATNTMLRSKTKGVAKNSQHTLGKAMDFFISGVPLTKLRHLGIRYQVGGVGYYPKSGSPFIHLDVGGVRAWPRLSRKELLTVFPDGKTVHIPSDGKPLPGYKQALAEVERRKSSGNSIAVASAAPAQKRSSTLFGALFGGGADEEEDVNDDKVRAATPTRRPATAAPRPTAPAAAPTPAEPLIAALPTRNVPLPVGAPRPTAPVAAEPAVTVPAAAPEQPPQPDNIPFAIAAAPEAAMTSPLAHAIIPVPARRPVTAVEDAIALAAATDLPPQDDSAAAPAMLTGFVPVPSSRPADSLSGETQMAAVANNDAIADLLQTEQTASTLPVPMSRDNNRSDSQQLATIASQGDLIAPPAEDDVFASAMAAVPSAKPAPQLVPAAPQPTVIAANTPKKNIQVASLDAQSSRTTAKSAKPNASKVKAKKAAIVKPATAPASELVMSSESVADAVPVTNPVLRNDAMRQAPAMVYTAGFQRDIPTTDRVNSFSGQAVTFLSVAKFKTAN